MRRFAVALMRVRQGYLSVVGSMRDQERHPYVLDNADQRNSRDEFHERIEAVLAPDPHHVIPIVRHRPIAFFGEAAPLQFAPVMVGAPGDAELEAFLKRGAAPTPG